MLAAGLLLAGWGILHLAGSSAPLQQAAPIADRPAGEAQPCGFGLKLSAVAESVELKARNGRVLFQQQQTRGPFTGMLALDETDPVVFVTLKWKDSTDRGDHFARLTLEPAGKPTITRYFEAPGTIEDVWELSEP